jgi:altronate dehydratase
MTVMASFLAAGQSAAGSTVWQIVGACVAAILVLGIGAGANYLRRINRTMADMPEIKKTLTVVEKHTNGEMAKQFKAVREDIALLKSEFNEFAQVRSRVERLEVAQAANDLVKQLLAAKDIPMRSDASNESSGSQRRKSSL